MAQFLMTIGVSGSGKSTYLKKFPKEGIVCPDDIRREITGDISDQSQNARVWFLAKERVLERLNKGEDVVLDATNTVSRNRQRFLADIPKGVEKVAVLFPLPDLAKAFQRIQKDIMEGVDTGTVDQAGLVELIITILIYVAIIIVGRFLWRMLIFPMLRMKT